MAVHARLCSPHPPAHRRRHLAASARSPPRRSTRSLRRLPPRRRCTPTCSQLRRWPLRFLLPPASSQPDASVGSQLATPVYCSFPRLSACRRRTPACSQPLGWPPRALAGFTSSSARSPQHFLVSPRLVVTAPRALAGRARRRRRTLSHRHDWLWPAPACRRTCSPAASLAWRPPPPRAGGCYGDGVNGDGMASAPAARYGRG